MLIITILFQLTAHAILRTLNPQEHAMGQLYAWQSTEGAHWSRCVQLEFGFSETWALALGFTWNFSFTLAEK